MTKKKRERERRQKRKTNKIINSVLDDLITEVEEICNPTEYFNIYKISNQEIDFLIDLDVKNVDMLNGLHSEKVCKDDNFTIVYIRKNKIPDFDKWEIYNDGQDKYLVSIQIITDIMNNIHINMSLGDIAKFYIKNDTNVINTILYITDPSILEREYKEYTPDQKTHNRIREILDEKNRIFNNRMKQNSSVKKLREYHNQVKEI